MQEKVKYKDKQNNASVQEDRERQARRKGYGKQWKQANKQTCKAKEMEGNNKQSRK